MGFFIEDALAEAAPAAAQQPDILAQFMVFGGIFLIFWLIFIRPQNKKMKEHREMVAALAKGDEVVTSGGLLGKVTALHDNFVTIEVARDINLNVQRQSVSSVMPKGTIKELKE